MLNPEELIIRSTVREYLEVQGIARLNSVAYTVPVVGPSTLIVYKVQEATVNVESERFVKCQLTLLYCPNVSITGDMW
jgi:hypothetical protein